MEQRRLWSNIAISQQNKSKMPMDVVLNGVNSLQFVNGCKFGFR